MSDKQKVKRQIVEALEEAKADKQAAETQSNECFQQSVDGDKAADGYGKFATAQELLNAYNALQSEFTKRCQLIAKLQARLDESNAQAQRLIAEDMNASDQISDQCAANAEQSHVVQSSVCDGEARLAEAVAVIAENIEECADYLASLPQIADAVILAYKRRLLCPRSAPSPRGMAVVMPVHRPKTLAEAKRLADEMLK